MEKTPANTNTWWRDCTQDPSPCRLRPTWGAQLQGWGVEGRGREAEGRREKGRRMEGGGLCPLPGFQLTCPHSLEVYWGDFHCKQQNSMLTDLRDKVHLLC